MVNEELKKQYDEVCKKFEVTVPEIALNAIKGDEDLKNTENIINLCVKLATLRECTEKFELKDDEQVKNFISKIEDALCYFIKFISKDLFESIEVPDESQLSVEQIRIFIKKHNQLERHAINIFFDKLNDPEALDIDKIKTLQRVYVMLDIKRGILKKIENNTLTLEDYNYVIAALDKLNQ